METFWPKLKTLTIIGFNFLIFMIWPMPICKVMIVRLNIQELRSMISWHSQIPINYKLFNVFWTWKSCKQHSNSNISSHRQTRCKSVEFNGSWILSFVNNCESEFIYELVVRYVRITMNEESLHDPLVRVVLFDGTEHEVYHHTRSCLCDVRR